MGWQTLQHKVDNMNTQYNDNFSADQKGKGKIDSVQVAWSFPAESVPVVITVAGLAFQAEIPVSVLAIAARPAVRNLIFSNKDMLPKDTIKAGAGSKAKGGKVTLALVQPDKQANNKK